MESALPVQMLVHTLDVVIHFGKLHARIGKHHRVERVAAFEQQQEHSRRVFTSR